MGVKGGHRGLVGGGGAEPDEAVRAQQYDSAITHAGARGVHATLLEVGSDHVLFSVDYPYETVQEQSDWFESLPIGDGDRLKIGRANALRLLRLGS